MLETLDQINSSLSFDSIEPNPTTLATESSLGFDEPLPAISPRPAPNIEPPIKHNRKSALRESVVQID